MARSRRVPPKSAAASSAFSRLPRSDQTRARRAVNRFSAWLEDEITDAQADARLRRLAAWRGVVRACRYLQGRFAGSDDAATARTAKPRHLKLDADLGLVLPELPWDVFATHIAEIERAIERLEPYEGVPFGRRFRVRGGRSGGDKPPADSDEQAHLARIEHEGDGLLGLFQQLETEITAAIKRPKRKKPAASAGKLLTPPQLARQWGVSPDKVLTWIRSGELRASNAATKPGGRPRYLIDPADADAFRARRTPEKPPERAPPKRHKPEGVIEFF